MCDVIKWSVYGYVEPESYETSLSRCDWTVSADRLTGDSVIYLCAGRSTVHIRPCLEACTSLYAVAGLPQALPEHMHVWDLVWIWRRRSGVQLYVGHGLMSRRAGRRGLHAHQVITHDRGNAV